MLLALSGRDPCNTTTWYIARDLYPVLQGDSGGPLVTEIDGVYNQIGVVSFIASAGCQLGYPDGFARVTSFLDWIESVTCISIESWVTRTWRDVWKFYTYIPTTT
jgi:secreted trypsin-like serine protease